MSPEMEHYHRGALSASVSMLSMPVMAACSAAHQTLFQARQIEPRGEERASILRQIEPRGEERASILRQIERLEEALKSLREAADLCPPVVKLMAAE